MFRDVKIHQYEFAAFVFADLNIWGLMVVEKWVMCFMFLAAETMLPVSNKNLGCYSLSCFREINTHH